VVEEEAAGGTVVALPEGPVKQAEPDEKNDHKEKAKGEHKVEVHKEKKGPK
jgi:hypothetical protein